MSMLSKIFLFFMFILLGTQRSLISASAMDPKMLSKVMSSSESKKPDDLKSLIAVLENPQKREALLKALREAESKKTPDSASTNAVTKTVDSFADTILDYVSQFPILWEDIKSAVSKLSDWLVAKKMLYLLAYLLLFMGVAFGLEKQLTKARHRIAPQYLKFLPHKTLVRLWWLGSSLVSTLLSSMIVFVSVHGAPDLTQSLNQFVYIFLGVRILSIIFRQIALFRNEKGQEKKPGESHKGFYRRFAVMIWSIAALLYAVGFLSAMGLPVRSYAFAMQVIQQLALLTIIFMAWELRYSLVLQIKESIPNPFRGVVHLLSRHYHYVITLWAVFLLYRGGPIVSSTSHPMITLLSFIGVLALWSLGRYGIEHLNHVLGRKKTFALMTYLADSRRWIIALLHGVWGLIMLGVFLKIVGIDVIGAVTSAQTQPYIRRFLSIVLILCVLRLLWLMTNTAIEQHLKPQKKKGAVVQPTQFTKTMAPIFKSLIHWVLVVLAVVFTLEECGVSVLPIFYGVGFLTITISLGAQSLVKDFINGFFTLMEGNIAVGDHVTLGQNTGIVESLSLRGVSLRHNTGALQSLPFSEVTNIINRSRDYTSLTFSIAINLDAPFKTVENIFRAAYEKIKADGVLGAFILSDLTISGVDKINDNTANVFASVKITPDPSQRFFRTFNRFIVENPDLSLVAPGPTEIALVGDGRKEVV